ncbi:hypothetical protein A35_02335 [Coxiella burnetii 'MSU Goat Q177']|nr:hypothetical protein A35_02335 [Coxiella burnetii 'MSU Goat Q177']
MERSGIRRLCLFPRIPISPYSAALHTYMDPPLLSTISFDEKKAVAFVYPASRFKLATIGALMNYARLMLIGLSASQSPRMNQLNQPQVLPYFHQPSLFRTRLVCLLLLILFFTHGGV